MNYELSVKNCSVRFYPVSKSNRPDYAEKMIKFVKQLNQTPNDERPSWQITTGSITSLLIFPGCGLL